MIWGVICIFSGSGHGSIGIDIQVTKMVIQYLMGMNSTQQPKHRAYLGVMGDLQDLDALGGYPLFGKLQM